MENYEQKYKEVLKMAKKELDTCGSQDCDAARQIFRFFPELKESEDERMIKSFKRLVKAYYDVNFPTPEGFEREDMLVWLEKQGERKPAWSEEDEKCFIELDTIIYQNSSLEDYDRLYNWLKSIKDRVQPQPKQEWSEEDEMFLFNITKDLEKLEKESKIEQLKDVYSKEICWLKSLKPNHWKPSEFQLECLRRVIPHHDTEIGNELEYVLTELYDNLKKL